MGEQADTPSKAYTFRPYEAEDIPFIQSSWGHSYYLDCQNRHLVSPLEFHAQHRPIRDALFMKRSATIVVCASKDDPDVILGWIAVEKPIQSKGTILHYIYVKSTFKGLGIASELFKMTIHDEPIIVTHLTKKARKIMKDRPNKFAEFYYIPHLA